MKKGIVSIDKYTGIQKNINQSTLGPFRYANPNDWEKFRPTMDSVLTLFDKMNQLRQMMISITKR